MTTHNTRENRTSRCERWKILLQLQRKHVVLCRPLCYDYRLGPDMDVQGRVSPWCKENNRQFHKPLSNSRSSIICNFGKAVIYDNISIRLIIFNPVCRAVPNFTALLPLSMNRRLRKQGILCLRQACISQVLKGPVPSRGGGKIVHFNSILSQQYCLASDTTNACNKSKVNLNKRSFPITKKRLQV